MWGGQGTNPWSWAEPQDLIRKPEVVGSLDPPRNKVAAWVCAHEEVGGEGGGPFAAFVPIDVWGQCHHSVL